MNENHELDLDILAPKPPGVTVGGARYKLLTADQISLADAARARQITRRVTAITKDITDSDEDPDPEAVQRLEQSADELLALIVPSMPEEVRRGLSLPQRHALMRFFQEETSKVGLAFPEIS